VSTLDDLFDAYNAGLLDDAELEQSLLGFDYVPVKRPAEYLLEEDPTDTIADQWTFPQDDTTQQIEDGVYTQRIPAELGGRVLARLRGGTSSVPSAPWPPPAIPAS
jgi:hypothetical protein